MKKFILLVLLLGSTVAVSTSCSRHEGAKVIIHVLNEKKAALERSEGPNHQNVNFVAYTAALQTIDVTGCPEKFRLAWKNYIEVVASRRGFGILIGGPNDIREAEGRIQDAAVDAGVTFDFPKK